MLNDVGSFHSHSRLHFIGEFKMTATKIMKPMVDAVVAASRNHSDTVVSEPPEQRREAAEGSITPYRSKLCVSPAELHQTVVAHIDMDAFFVSVALRNRPDLRDKPVAIGTGKGDHCELSSLNYVARSKGLRGNGLWYASARKVCPDLVVLPYQFEEYTAVVTRVYEIVLEAFGRAEIPFIVEVLSVDEVLVGAESSVAVVNDVVSDVREAIESELQCTASAGIASNVALARLATESVKPDGQKALHTYEEAHDFLDGVSIRSIHGIGRVAFEKLQTLRRPSTAGGGPVETCGHLRTVPRSTLQTLLGPKNGDQLYQLMRGVDMRQVQATGGQTTRTPQSVGSTMNYAVRPQSDGDMQGLFLQLATDIVRKLQAAELRTSKVALKVLVRHPDAPVVPPKHLGCGRCVDYQRTAALNVPTSSSQVLLTTALRLWAELKPSCSSILDVRGVGLQCTMLTSASSAEPRRTESLTQLMVRKGSSASASVKNDSSTPLVSEAGGRIGGMKRSRSGGLQRTRTGSRRLAPHGSTITVDDDDGSSQLQPVVEVDMHRGRQRHGSLRQQPSMRYSLNEPDTPSADTSPIHGTQSCVLLEDKAAVARREAEERRRIALERRRRCADTIDVTLTNPSGSNLPSGSHVVVNDPASGAIRTMRKLSGMIQRRVADARNALLAAGHIVSTSGSLASRSIVLRKVGEYSATPVLVPPKRGVRPVSAPAAVPTIPSISNSTRREVLGAGRKQTGEGEVSCAPPAELSAAVVLLQRYVAEVERSAGIVGAVEHAKSKDRMMECAGMLAAIVDMAPAKQAVWAQLRAAVDDVTSRVVPTGM